MDERVAITGSSCAGNAPKLTVSEGQDLLERLLAAAGRLYELREQFAKVKASIGVESAPTAQEGKTPGTEVTAFLPGLRLLATRIEGVIEMIEQDVEQLRRAF